MKSDTSNPEFELLLAIARSEDGLDAYRQIILTHQIDWDYLINIAEFQRMMPLVHLALKDTCTDLIPDQYFNQLKTEFFVNTQQNIALLSELLHLLKLLEENNIEAIPFKGAVLSKILYDDYSTRQAGDIDILVKPEDVHAAIDLLEQRGFILTRSLTKDQQGALVNISSDKHHMLVNDQNKLAVEIHWGFTHTDIMGKKDSLLLWNWLETKPVNSVPVNFIRPEPLLLILCLHGYKHSWDRLFWLWEFSTMVQKVDLDWDWIMQHAENFGGINMLLVSLLLANRTLGTPIPPGIKEEFLTNDEVLHLLNGINLKPNRFELEAKNKFPILNVRTRFRVKGGIIPRLRQILSFAFTPNYFDIQVISLPPTLYFLYFLVRPLRLLFRNIKLLFSPVPSTDSTA